MLSLESEVLERRLQERGIEFEQVIGLLSQYTGCLSLVGGRKFA
ncbi:hypothetical protein [Mannheimia haemolytica]|nr:hypothetical protein [Mannheimia haemolytica]